MSTTAPAAQQTVRGAVAQRETAAKVTPAQAIKHQLDFYSPVILDLLGSDPKAMTRFKATIANACRTTPELLRCEPATVVAAALRCAQLNLEPNDSRNLCWILPYAGKASWQLGYGGVLELARRAEPGLITQGSPVYPNDEFDIDLGRAKPLIHRPHWATGKPQGGDAFAWYIRLLYADGREFVHGLGPERVEYHRSFSKQPNGQMWSKSYDAAALKSVVMDMKRFLPQSAELNQAMSSDDRVLTIDEVKAEAEDPMAALPPVGVDEETGEKAS